jgi:CHAT domain-containing protein
MRTIWATTWLKLYLKAGAFDGPDMSFRTEAEKNVEAYTATIDQAVWLFRDRAISIPDILYPRALTATEAAAALGTDEVLFVAVPGDTFVHSFAITRDGFSWSTTAVSWSEVWDNVQDLRRNLGVPDGRGLGQETGGNETPAGGVSGASWLYDTLLKPHEALLKNKRRLLVSATNAAARIPFEMLLATPPEPDQDFPEMDWLVKHHSVLALPSVELLLGRKPTPRRDAIYYFGVGNPDYKAVANSRYKSAVMRMIESLTPLPDSAGEVQDLAAVFGKDKGLAVTGATANEQLLEESSAEGILNRFTILHFATHGMAAGDHEDALQPLLALSPPPYPLPDVANTVDKLLAVERDGALTASEISGLKIAAKLVILSACNSATPEPFERDGQGGLSAAFMAAGAEDVLATHWPVNSRAAVEIVTGMMKADPGLEDLPAALQTSLTAMIAKGGPEAHPRYWAPFSLIGFP